jgi:uncharacterized membrane protein YciS (DUF1049 family)
MRLFYLLLLAIMLAAVGIFAYQNDGGVTVRYLDRSVSYPLAWVVGASYLLGMLSGWTVVGLFRRSLQRVTERPQSQ